MISLVDGVDHVYVPMLDAEAAFEVLATELELPILWPFTSFGKAWDLLLERYTKRSVIDLETPPVPAGPGGRRPEDRAS